MAAKESVKAKLQSNLSDFSALTRQLLEVLSGEIKPSAGSMATTDQQHQLLSSVLDRLIARDREIQQLAETAIEMRVCQREIEQVDGELERRKQQISDLQTQLQDAERILELAVYLGKQKLDSIKQASEGSVSPEELIRYAHRISQANSTVSPVGWQPSDPRRPYPQDIEMRSGWLGRLNSTSQHGSVVLAESGPGASGKKLATEGTSIRLLQGVNQNNNKDGAVGGSFKPFVPGAQSFSRMQTFEEPEVMSEDSSPSSSDEGT